MDWFINLFLASPSWTRDQKIQAAILCVLLLTMGVSAFFEILKGRRAIHFIDITVRTYSNGSPSLTVRFVNDCHRKLWSVYIDSCVIKGDPQSESRQPAQVQTLNEGEMASLSLYFKEGFSYTEKDVQRIVLRDSVGKSYVAHLYKGKIRSFWMTHLHKILDK